MGVKSEYQKMLFAGPEEKRERERERDDVPEKHFISSDESVGVGTGTGTGAGTGAGTGTGTGTGTGIGAGTGTGTGAEPPQSAGQEDEFSVPVQNPSPQDGGPHGTFVQIILSPENAVKAKTRTVRIEPSAVAGELSQVSPEKKDSLMQSKSVW